MFCSLNLVWTNAVEFCNVGYFFFFYKNCITFSVCLPADGKYFSDELQYTSPQWIAQDDSQAIWNNWQNILMICIQLNKTRHRNSFHGRMGFHTSKNKWHKQEITKYWFWSEICGTTHWSNALSQHTIPLITLIKKLRTIKNNDI